MRVSGFGTFCTPEHPLGNTRLYRAPSILTFSTYHTYATMTIFGYVIVSSFTLSMDIKLLRVDVILVIDLYGFAIPRDLIRKSDLKKEGAL